MANTLTSLLPDLYEALDVVSRELTGMIPAVTLDANAARAAVGQSILVPITPAADVENTTPGSIPPDTGDQTIDNTTIEITKSRTAPFRWLGEEVKGVNAGPGFSNLRAGQIAQAIRALVNEVEADLCGLYPYASRACGTAGTTPFGTPGIADAAAVLKILQDNGAPLSDLHLTIDTAAGLKLRSLAQLTQANTAGTATMREQGVLLNLFGFNLRESAKVALHTAGTGTSYVINHPSTDLAVGASTIAMDGGSGTILAGDAVVFEGDAEKYIVKTALSAGSLVINKPGLMAALADGKTVTRSASYRANMAFHRGAMVLVARAPALPQEGDAATDRMVITDPRTGLSFELAMYPQYRRIRYEISLAWGVACIKPEHCAVLLG